MRSGRIVSQRLAAVLQHRQIEAIVRAETVADETQRAIEALAQDAVAIAVGLRSYQAPTRRAAVAQRLKQMPQVAIETLLDFLTRLGVWSHGEAAKGLADSIPRHWWFSAQSQRATEADGDLPAPVVRTTRVSVAEVLRGETEIPSLAKLMALMRKESVDAFTDAEWQEIAEKVLFPPPSPETVRRMVLAPNPQTGQTWTDRLATLSREIDDPDAVASQLVTGYSLGENLQQLYKRVLPLTNGIQASARRVARTEGLRVAEQVQRESWDFLGDLMVGTQILAVLDQNTRPHHASRSGTIFYKAPKPGQKSIAELPNLPDEPNCLLPGQFVSGEFSGGLKAFYAGKVCELRTLSGRSLAVTANHPVLTAEGWVPAHLLCEGDDLLRHVIENERPAVMPDHIDQAPAVVEDAFRTLADLGEIRRTSRVDLDADTVNLVGEVDVVAAERELRDDGHAERSQRHSDLRLPAADVQLEAEASISSLETPRERIATAAPRSPRLAGLPLDGRPIGLHSRPLRSLRLGLAAELHARFLQSLRDRPAIETLGLREFVDRLAGFVATDQIVEVRHYDWSGHVYDLQTEVGWFTAGGLIIRNCRCWTSPVLSEPDDAEQNEELQQVLTDNEKNSIPDPSAYVQWWRGADEGRRKLAVGVRRYEVVSKALPEGFEPEWIDFIDEDGKLLPIDDLRNETEQQREKRKARVREALLRREELLRQVARQGFATRDRTADPFTQAMLGERP